jgi:Fe2+ or Zn2+ uptake regulation protein
MSKEIKLTEKDLKILEVISRNPAGISPTNIGVKLGQPYNSASAYCNSSLRKLLELGKVVKIKSDGVKYKKHSKS